MNNLIPSDYNHNITMDNETILKIAAVILMLMILSAVIHRLIG